jgi:hypothetical protein
MTSGWYQEVSLAEPIDQGDLILGCPVISWRPDGDDLPDIINQTLNSEDTARFVQSRILDVVVLTQTCDLAQAKAPRVVLCRFYRLADYKRMFKSRFDDYKDMDQLAGKKLDAKLDKLNVQWKKHCTGMKNGSSPNYCLIEAVDNASHGEEQLVVDFSEIHSAPTKWLEQTIQKRSLPRVKLLPPYRDYVAHNFGRMYSRVGLDPDLRDSWQTF